MKLSKKRPMSILEALSDDSQNDARANIKTGDDVLVVYQSDLHPFHPVMAKVTKTTPKYIFVGILKFYRGGKQVGERENQKVHCALYAITPEVNEALKEQGGNATRA